jgi:hypothetical protein
MEIGINMKNALILLCILLGIEFANASCSTQITRTNSSPNTVLTSTKYNTDLNTVYTKVNDLDGDCITDDSLPWGSIDETTVPPLAKGVKEGCLATRSDANTISIGKCLIAVNGVQIEKTTATTVTWGCTGCSSEIASTTYYVYAIDASVLTLKISTSAPDAFGYNGTERVLAYFYNNASSDIDSQSVGNWVVNGFTNGPFAEMMKVPAVNKPIIFGFENTSLCSSGTCITREFGVDTTSTFSSTGVYVTSVPSGVCSNTPFCVDGTGSAASSAAQCKTRGSSSTSITTICATTAVINELFGAICICQAF